ncbi:RNA binding motif protein 22 [Rhizophlyctis rosea]|uniref:RNA binding motif protein 22 n=1 Tax=Rhizophlyctis rosea TaxID=64517 RepID=A0AAD5SGF8_9FUNG|nr:RNA binding motif protein 22 [Rhizophlyctis rosea]
MAKQGWEDSEFPILCETCLGDNPYVRMTRQGFGKECKICGRPFTIFRWTPGAGMRMKKTEICQTCAKIKNTCQTCVLDLEFGLPVQVRDSVLNVQQVVPQSNVNREFFVQNAEREMGNQSLVDYGKADSAAKEVLKKMTRVEPYYKRNKPHICSFYVKGECKRGDECPFRHELPVANDLSNQNIKDRYYGQNDPVAQRMLNRTDKPNKLGQPDDKAITSLFITGVEADITEQDLRNHFYPFGEIKSVVVVHKSKCAFINFATRSAAEQAVEKAYNNCNIKGHVLRVQWGKPRPQGPKGDSQTEGGGGSSSSSGGAGPSGSGSGSSSGQMSLDDLLKMPAMLPPPGAVPSVYPSMDPTSFGTTSRDYRA